MSKNINYGLVALVAIFAALISSLVTYKAMARNQSAIAVVDLERVVMASKDVASLRAERDNQMQDLQKMADDANSKINAEKKDDEKKKLSEKYLAEINSKKEAYDQAYATAIQASDKKISDIINAVAQKEGLNVVINKSYLINGGVDITDSVIEQVR